jgi:hypothetical protein
MAGISRVSILKIIELVSKIYYETEIAPLSIEGTIKIFLLEIIAEMRKLIAKISLCTIFFISTMLIANFFNIYSLRMFFIMQTKVLLSLTYHLSELNKLALSPLKEKIIFNECVGIKGRL